VAEPLLVRKGESKVLMLGPDPWVLRATGAETDGRFDFIEGTVSYLQGPPLHAHNDQDDTILVVSGTLKVQIGDDLFDLQAGDFMSAPKGVPHTFANLEREPVRLVNVMTPGGFHRVLEDYATLPQGPPDPKLLERLAEKHGIAVLGPPIPVRLGLV